MFRKYRVWNFRKGRKGLAKILRGRLWKDVFSELVAFKVLSLDGGGIRGAFLAAFLVKLQENLNQPLLKYFDLVVLVVAGELCAEIAPEIHCSFQLFQSSIVAVLNAR